MSKKLVNLTLPLVEQELDSLLEVYPHILHQAELSNPDLRQELLAYVLNRINNVYAAKEDCSLDESNISFCFTPEQQMQIETLIFQGINYVLPAQYSDKICA